MWINDLSMMGVCGRRFQHFFSWRLFGRAAKSGSSKWTFGDTSKNFPVKIPSLNTYRDAERCPVSIITDKSNSIYTILILYNIKPLSMHVFLPCHTIKKAHSSRSLYTLSLAYLACMITLYYTEIILAWHIGHCMITLYYTEI